VRRVVTYHPVVSHLTILSYTSYLAISSSGHSPYVSIQSVHVKASPHPQR